MDTTVSDMPEKDGPRPQYVTLRDARRSTRLRLSEALLALSVAETRVGAQEDGRFDATLSLVNGLVDSLLAVDGSLFRALAEYDRRTDEARRRLSDLVDRRRAATDAPTYRMLSGLIAAEYRSLRTSAPPSEDAASITVP